MGWVDDYGREDSEGDRNVAYHRAVLIGKDCISRLVFLSASETLTVGRLPRATCLTELITALNKAEGTCRGLESRFQAVLGAMEAGAYGIDNDGRCLFINETGALLLGVDPQNLLGKPIHDLITCSSHDGTWRAGGSDLACEGFRPGKGCPTEGVTVWKHNGMTLLIEYACSPIMESGEITGTVVTFIDISARRTNHPDAPRKCRSVSRTRPAQPGDILDGGPQEQSDAVCQS